MKKQILIITTIIITILFANTGCKPKKNDTLPTVDSGKLYVHLHTNIDTNEVGEYDIPYVTSHGRKVSLSKAQLYISNIQLVKPDGSLYSIPNTIILKQLDPETYFVANIPTGLYKSIKFNVGLDANTDQLANTAMAALNDSNMWMGASPQPNGYAFVNAQGKIDTTANAIGTEAQMQPFIYKIATNSHYTSVSMPEHTPVFSCVKDQAMTVHMTIDYNKLFTGVQLNSSANLTVVSVADNGTTNANTVANNIVSMFSYEE